jgi:ketosteroid isomerase-like protein
VKSLLGLLMLLALASCAPQKPDMVALKGVIDEYNSLVTKSMLEGNVSATMSYYADDAVSMPASGPMLKGKEAIQKNSDEMMKSGMKFTAVKFTSSEVGGSGTLAYEIGTYDMSMEIGPTKIDDNGKYMTLWKKQADGSWKVFSEIWNSSVEAPH